MIKERLKSIWTNFTKNWRAKPNPDMQFGLINTETGETNMGYMTWDGGSY